jgi:hypothetical protein
LAAGSDRSFNDHAELFVVVMVFWKLRARLDFDHRECQPLTMDSAGELPGREHLRRDRLQSSKASMRLVGDCDNRIDDDWHVER